MKDMRDYLKQKAASLGLERADQLVNIQAYLDQLYPGMCRAATLHEGVLKITTHNASIASELRMRQIELKKRLEVKRITIQIV